MTTGDPAPSRAPALESGDTADRSLAHWSEARRAEMDAFYRVATLDYRELAQALDWHAALSGLLGDDGPVRVLDVACGSGKFPAALVRHTRLPELPAGSVEVDLLDPSPFSLAEARKALERPFVGGRDFACTLQDLPAGPGLDGSYDVVWATHALYALPEADLEAGARAFLRALGPGEGRFGFVAHADAASHYLAFYDVYMQNHRPDATPYTCGEQVAAAFRAVGAEVEVATLVYEQVIDDDEVLEGFLQRCLFDSGWTLGAMRADPALGAYLDARRGADGVSRFRQQVSAITVRA